MVASLRILIREYLTLVEVVPAKVLRVLSKALMVAPKGGGLAVARFASHGGILLDVLISIIIVGVVLIREHAPLADSLDVLGAD